MTFDPETPGPSLDDLTLLTVANRYAESAVKMWLWDDLLGKWTRAHLEREKVIDAWFRNLGSRIGDIRSLDHSLPLPSPGLKALFEELGISLCSPRVRSLVEYISLAALVEVEDRRERAAEEAESNPTWQQAFKLSSDLGATEAAWVEKLAICNYKQGSSNSWAGDLVNRYKYRLIHKDERKEITEKVARAVAEFILYKFAPVFVDPKVPPFDAVLGVPSNNSEGKALPVEVSSKLSENHSWLHDLNDAVEKNEEH